MKNKVQIKLETLLKDIRSKNPKRLLPYVPAIVVVLGFAITGIILTVASHAATYTAPKEAESGAITGVAVSTPDSKASAGSYVKFSGGGSPPTAPPPTTPPPTTPPPTTPPASGDPTATTCPSPTPVGTDAKVLALKPNLCEDFNSGLGKFSAYSGGGGDTVINRVASQCTNGGGYLALKQASNGDTCGGDMSPLEQSYGYWEVRMKAGFSSSSTSGSKPHPVLIIWAPGNVWNDGEMDFFETDLGSKAGGFLHCVGNPQSNCVTLPSNNVDYSQWHVYGFEWRADGGRGFIDGNLWWDIKDNGWSIKKPGHMTIQLDNFGSAPAAPGEMDVDWVHAYK
jgi:hypothetical protein